MTREDIVAQVIEKPLEVAENCRLQIKGRKGDTIHWHVHDMELLLLRARRTTQTAAELPGGGR